MLAVAMNTTAPQIQTQSLQEHVPISQSSTSTSPSSEQMLVAPATPLSPSKRPKLSLQTSSVPVAVGKSTTSLSVSLSALQSASPTIRNTFSNAYEIPLRPSPVSASAKPQWPKPISSTITKREEQPYELPPHVKSILRNPPYISSLRRSALSAANSASPRTGRRVFFPPIKKVAYRTPLEEEIKTIKFIARHSDLSSEEDSDSDNKLPGDNADGNERHQEHLSYLPTPLTGTDGVREEVPARSPPLKRGKRKRKPREWRWTLGPIEDEEITTPAATPHPRAGLFINTKTTIHGSDIDEQTMQKTPFPFGMS